MGVHKGVERVGPMIGGREGKEGGGECRMYNGIRRLLFWCYFEIVIIIIIIIIII